MPVVELRVSPLTNRILSTEYGVPPPYKVQRSHFLYHLLTGDPIRKSRYSVTRLTRELRESIQLRVSDELYRRLRYRDRQLTVGYFLHKAMQERMLLFVEAQVTMGIPAQRALKNFMDRYHIDEDDYSLDTAYTAWKRRKEQFSVEKEENPANIRRVLEPLKFAAAAGRGGGIPADPRWVVSAVQDHFECGYMNLLCRDVVIDTDMGFFLYPYDEDTAAYHIYARKVLAFLLDRDAGMTKRDITSMIHRDIAQISRYVQEIDVAMQTYEDVQADVRAIRRGIAAYRPN